MHSEQPAGAEIGNGPATGSESAKEAVHDLRWRPRKEHGLP